MKFGYAIENDEAGIDGMAAAVELDLDVLVCPRIALASNSVTRCSPSRL
jgi:hypothetical protein